MKEPTKKQMAVYRFLNDYFRRKGYAPTAREIADKFKWKSATAARDNLTALARKGKIRLDDRAHRNIVII